MSGLNDIFFTQISATAQKDLHKIHVAPVACVGKCESNIFFAKFRESRIKKVRKVE